MRFGQEKGGGKTRVCEEGRDAPDIALLPDATATGIITVTGNKSEAASGSAQRRQLPTAGVYTCIGRALAGRRRAVGRVNPGGHHAAAGLVTSFRM